LKNPPEGGAAKLQPALAGFGSVSLTVQRQTNRASFFFFQRILKTQGMQSMNFRIPVSTLILHAVA
jgi:hypothetical protein